MSMDEQTKEEEMSIGKPTEIEEISIKEPTEIEEISMEEPTGIEEEMSMEECVFAELDISIGSTDVVLGGKPEPLLSAEVFCLEVALFADFILINLQYQCKD
ncbi:hypothetical protein Tco_0999057 [Tanacetum coccineum]